MVESLLSRNAGVRREFQAKLALEPAFIADADARLIWLSGKLPHRDDFLLTDLFRREI
ncbi:hypothetical protein QUC32_03470 [Novosphingobium resinovorum]|uniref:hypothetical protein n=1 Tax=Novosphingobium resinovorum TaxID=158500 RepID=UPI0025A03D18|nr:hypothetical protein [Novosphingobium resinovorum]MBF7013877.1 hypothetical protein [Novosphingobium sp. HR1a]WJM26023.1 hypothetical protein QUC32_03470 [Novosphingobium resinovorum]